MNNANLAGINVGHVNIRGDDDDDEYGSDGEQIAVQDEDQEGYSSDEIIGKARQDI